MHPSFYYGRYFQMYAFKLACVFMWCICLVLYAAWLYLHVEEENTKMYVAIAFLFGALIILIERL